MNAVLYVSADAGTPERSLSRRLTPARVVRSLAFRARRFLAPPAPRAAEPYGTHVPVLIGVARLLPIRRVLELGCGKYSTLTFLDPVAFPHLERLDSFETDPIWRDEILMAAQHDPRLEITIVNGPMAAATASMPFHRYDLVLVDDSADEASRAASITAVAERHAPSNIVVIHDFEMQSYRLAAEAIPRRFAFTAFNPHTGVAWDTAPLAAADLRRLERLMKRYANSVPPHDRARWGALVDARFRRVHR